LFIFYPEQIGQDCLHRMHALRTGRQHETVFIGIPLADRRSRLHVVADQPVVDEFDAGNGVGLGESPIGLCLVADAVIERAIGAEFRPDQRRIRI
jgi:hypothetical protein